MYEKQPELSGANNLTKVINSISSRVANLPNNQNSYVIQHSKAWKELGSEREVDQRKAQIVENIKAGRMSLENAKKEVDELNAEWVEFAGESQALATFAKKFAYEGYASRGIVDTKTSKAQEIMQRSIKGARQSILAQHRQVKTDTIGGNGMSNLSQAQLEFDRLLQSGKERQKEIQPQLDYYDKEEEFLNRMIESYGFEVNNSKRNYEIEINDILKAREQAAKAQVQKKMAAIKQRKENEKNGIYVPEGKDEFSMGLSQLSRFSMVGEILGNNSKYSAAMTPDNELNLRLMKQLSQSLLTNPKTAKFFNQDATQEEAQALAKQLPEFISAVQRTFVEEYNKQVQLGKENHPDFSSSFQGQLRRQIYNTATMQGILDSQGGTLTDKQMQNYLEEIFPFVYGKTQYQGRTWRVTENKQGIFNGPSKYKSGIEAWGGLPQYIGGALPYFPRSDEDTEKLTTIEGRKDLLEKFLSSIDEIHRSIKDNTPSGEVKAAEDKMNQYYGFINEILKTLPQGNMAKFAASTDNSIYGVIANHKGFQLLDKNNITQEDIKSTSAYINSQIGKGLPEEEIAALQQWVVNLQGYAERLNYGRSSEADDDAEKIADLEIGMRDLLDLIKQLDTNKKRGYTKQELQKLATKSFKGTSYYENLRLWASGSADAKDLDIPYYDIVGGKDPVSGIKKKGLKPKGKQDGEPIYTKNQLEHLVEKFEDTLGTYYAKTDESEFGVEELTEDENQLIELALKLADEKDDAVKRAASERLQTSLQPFIDSYARAKTSGQKGLITKNVKAQFGVDSTEFAKWQEIKGGIVPIDEAKEIVEEQKEQLFTLQGNIVSGLEEGKNFHSNITKTYGKSAKGYSGPALTVNGQTGFIGDFARAYREMDSAKRPQMFQDVVDVFDSLEREQQEIIYDQLQTSNQKGIDAFRNQFTQKYSAQFVSPEQAQATDQNINKIQAETEAIKTDNVSIGEHNEALKTAAVAETNKAEMAEALAKALMQEKQAVDEVTTSLEKNTDSIEENVEAKKDEAEVTYSYEPLRFDDKTHSYYRQGASGQYDEKVMSITQLRDILLNKNNPAYKADMVRMNAAINNAMENGSVLNPEMLGMQANDFRNYTYGIASGIKGDTFHEAIDLLAKNEVTSLEQLKEKNENAYNEYIEYKKNQVKKLATIGYDEEYLHLNDNIEAYVKAAEQAQMTLSKFSEQRLGLNITRGDKSYTIGVGPDQIGMIREMTENGPVTHGVQLDTKTGGLHGYESFQLTAQKMAILAAKQSDQVSEEWKKQIGESGLAENSKQYIVDIKDGRAKLVEYLQLTKDEMFKLVDMAHQVASGAASAPNAQELDNLWQRQLKTGSFTATSDSYVAPEEKEAAQQQLNEAIKNSVTYLEKWYKLDSEIYEIEQKLLGARGEEREALEAQVATKRIEANDLATRYQKHADIVDSLVPTYGLTDAQAKQLNEGWTNARNSAEVRRAQGDVNANLFISKQQNKEIQEYLKAYKELQKIQRDIYRTELKQKTATASQKADYEAQKELLRMRQNDLTRQVNSYNFDSEVYSAEKLNELTRQRNALDQEHQISMSGITAQYDKQKTLLQMLFGTLQTSVTRFFDYSGVFMVINEIKKVITDIFNYTSALDQKIVNLQIASGESRENIKDMLGNYNELAAQVGRTTAQVSDAANDWLRAGYEGKESMQLTKGSMYLSTLGLMEAGEATSALISVLKGWKLSVDEVIPVIDKLVKVDVNAAVSAGEIANSMQLVNYSAQQAGLSMDTLIGILTTNKDVTQRSAQVVGNSWKTIVARAQNVKANKFEPSDLDRAEEGFAEEDWASLKIWGFVI